MKEEKKEGRKQTNQCLFAKKKNKSRYYLHLVWCTQLTLFGRNRKSPFIFFRDKNH